MGYAESRKADVLFEHLYTDVDPRLAQSLLDFRSNNPSKLLDTDGVRWEYLSIGDGDNTILFLHGMAGAGDIWWQQIEALRDQFRIISVTYPVVDSLAGLSQGILEILAEEGVKQLNIVGTSLGGYLAQYLVAQDPNRFRRAVFGNTFPPNDRIARKTRGVETLLRTIPHSIFRSAIRRNTSNRLFPASGRSELLKAYLNEGVFRGLTKSVFTARYRCVIEKFEPLEPSAQILPVLIIEADNDPIVDPTLRDQLKRSYPEAQVLTFHNAGHFPYLNLPIQYNQSLLRFLLSSQ